MTPDRTALRLAVLLVHVVAVVLGILAGALFLAALS
jgi:hypothetical protein